MAGAIDWTPVREVIEEKRSFLITSHVNPEGDAIGSEVALERFLKGRSRSVRIVNPSPTPENCRYLDPEGRIVLFDPSRANAVFEGVDAVFILDLSSWEQLGSFAPTLREKELPRYCIDHHEGPDREIASHLICDPSAAAAGLLVYEMIQDLGGPITPQIAEPLYAAILTDTGSFRFSNTDRRALLAAADLLRTGIRPERIYANAFENRRWASAKLLSPVFASLGRSCGGKIAWVQVTRKMLAEVGGSYEDTEGIIELLRGIRGVEVCLVFKEHERGKIRVSLRSTGDVDIHRLAQSYGGGGHSRAAGITFEGTMEEAVRDVVASLETLVGG